MFWSHDLLGKKTALGAVWIAAHGKKLNKAKVLQVNVAEACNKVMDPEVPQALRLQAILVGGIAIVHAKQQYFLLEDAQEMLRRVRALGAEAGAEAAAKVTLGDGKQAAREEAITLPMNGDLAMLNLGALFPEFPDQGPTLSEGAARSGRSRSQQAGDDGLFVMPDGLTQEAAASPARSAKQKRSRGTGATGGAAGAAEAGGGGAPAYLLGGFGEGEVALSLEGLPRHDLELMDGPETFAVPDIDLPGLDFLGGGYGAEPPHHPDLPDDLLPVPSGLGVEGPLGGPEVAQPAPPASQTPQASSERTESERPGGAAPRTGKAGRRRKGARKALLDDIDTLQIRGREYREWMSDRSDLLVARPQRALAAVPTAAPAAAAAAAKSALAAGPATAALMPGGAWPEELAGLFARAATLPTVAPRPRKAKKGGGAAAAEEEEEEALSEQERRLDAAAAGGSRAALLADDGLGLGFLDAGLEPGFAADGYGYGGAFGDLGAGQDWLGGGGAGGSAFARGAAEALAAAQQPGEYEEEFDVETERLRAALNDTTQSLGAPGFFGLTPGSAAAGAGAGTRGKRASSALRRDDELGAMSERSSEGRRGSRLSDLREAPLSGGLGGAGAGADLAGMLPVVGEEEAYLEEEEEEEEGEGGSAKRRRTGGSAGTQSQFVLLEASGPTQEPGAAGGAMNRQTLAFVRVLRERFEAAEGGGEAAEEGAPEEGGELSLFGLSDRLNRLDASKLFYQVLVSRSAGFLKLHQEEPFGDIALTPGLYL